MGKGSKKKKRERKIRREIEEYFNNSEFDSNVPDLGEEWPLYCPEHHCYTHTIPNLEGVIAYVCFGKKMSTAQLQKLKKHKPEPDAHLLAVNSSFASEFLQVAYIAPAIISAGVVAAHMMKEKPTIQEPPYFVPFAVESYAIHADAWPDLVRSLQKETMSHR